MGLFDEILKSPSNAGVSPFPNGIVSEITGNVVVLEPGVTRAYCEGCNEIQNLAKVPEMACKCGRLFKRGDYEE